MSVAKNAKEYTNALGTNVPSLMRLRRLLIMTGTAGIKEVKIPVQGSD